LSLTILLNTLDLEDLLVIVLDLLGDKSQLAEEITILFNISKEKEEGLYE